MHFQRVIPALALAALSFGAQAATYPLKIENCGQTLTFDKAPAAAVTIGQAGTEMLYALGLGDKVVGTSLWFHDVLPQFKEINSKVPRLADNAPSFESVIGKRPNLVVSAFEWMVGKEGVVGTREQFHNLGIMSYAMPSDCEGKDNFTGADGTRTKAYNVESLYKSIKQLAEIFSVEAKGEALIKDIRTRAAKAEEKVRAAKIKDLSAALWFSSADITMDPYMAGQSGVAGYMMKALGMRNVVTSNEEWPTVGWETIAKANPSVLIIYRMDRRRFAADDYQKKLEFLKSDPVTKQMDAVKNDRIVIVDADALQGSIRMADGLEQMAEGALKIKGAKK